MITFPHMSLTQDWFYEIAGKGLKCLQNSSAFLFESVAFKQKSSPPPPPQVQVCLICCCHYYCRWENQQGYQLHYSHCSYPKIGFLAGEYPILQQCPPAPF